MKTASAPMVRAASPAASFRTDDERWLAVRSRDPAAVGAFFYAVRSTGIYCTPTCSSRMPLRKNVTFFDTPALAEAAGFRPCKRCSPHQPALSQVHRQAVERVCRAIDQADATPLDLGDMARIAGISPFHFHRIFRAATGLTPKQYTMAKRAERVRATLQRGTPVTEAIYESGFGSSSRFYDRSETELGMTPSAYRTGARGIRLRVGIERCSLGHALVAATDRGICAILLGDDPEALRAELRLRFPKAVHAPADEAFAKLVRDVIAFLDSPGAKPDLPLDLQGTLFQQRIWRALADIPAGTTVIYSELAKRLGIPRSTRAIARACATNTIAVAIPCHRVVRTDGELAGYRWGLDRKRQLLLRERRSD